VQVGRYHRFWINNNGSLRVIVVTPQTPSSHPEWSDLFSPNRPDVLNMRVLDRRIGYFINVIEKDLNIVDTTVMKKSLRKEKVNEGMEIMKYHKTTVEIFCGLHLYRCWGCKRVLLKPLQCAKCKAVVYCGRTCQRADWTKHKPKC